MTGSVAPFQPSAPTLAISASTTSASATLTASGDALVVYNSTSNPAFVVIGSSSVTATAAGYPVPPGQRAMMALPSLCKTVGVVLSSGTGTVYVAVGTGTEY